MKTKSEILKKYRSQDMYGNPIFYEVDVSEAMEVYKKESIDELADRLADARYIIKIMFDKIPLEQTTARMSTIISEISTLLNKHDKE